MQIVITIDTKPKGLEYTKAGSIVTVDDAEGLRLCYLGFAKEIKSAPKKAATKKK